ncbi:hypothetical protein AGABI2DRAFT_217401 [Agaricus bisporus var. bisporus H97]|uniref:hypothetical protein n=1 Tax=Agaricus bisporus var. bisporus (strain H97 / ATCC MYA-4626 / FGSC 10389) TaxID=936046 RepID=UPI00029F6FF0|nr:hypothetical protein AGABI2DRAFT_217401 [Agaricus bisporus var. bisporus H97]EKV50604.1 hypothetical protein AGABI2DRAFT_217401 [Agaricus bisporus var. bisporus H97]
MMSGPNTPFIPPLLAPSPGGNSPAPVIPPDPTRPQPASGPTAPAMQPQYWSPHGPSFPGALPQQQHPAAYYGGGVGTPYQPFIPPQAYSASLGGQTPLPPLGSGGLAADYTGLPTHIPPSPMGQPQQFAPPAAWHGGHANTVPLHHAPGMQQIPPPSPWYPGTQHPGVRLNVPGGFAGTPLAGGDPFAGGGWPSPAGFNPGFISNVQHPGMGGNFYDMGAAAAAAATPAGGWGMFAGAQPAQPAQPPPPERIAKDAGNQLSKWGSGPHYGPVLSPFQLKSVDATLEINPLLLPVSEDGGDQVHLKWNMLMPPSLVQRSDDGPHISWSKGRNEPASFPRINQLRITSEHFPWLMEVRAQDQDTGVTCGEVIDTIARNMDKLTSASDYNSLPKQKQAQVNRAYRHNRSRSADVPGGRLGEGLKRMDFLCDLTAFGGLVADESTVNRTCNVALPGYVVLSCRKERTPLEVMEVQKQRAQDLYEQEEALAKERLEAQQARERTRNMRAQNSRRGSARGSVAGSTRGSVAGSVRGSVRGSTSTSASGSPSESDIGIDVEEASDDDSSYGHR